MGGSVLIELMRLPAEAAAKSPILAVFRDEEASTLTDRQQDLSSVGEISAIVAHELGHAQQHENNSFLITMRNVLVPAVSFSSPLAYVCIFFGFLFNLAGLVTLGILFYAIMVIFTFVTLPVEFDASRRALASLSRGGYMTDAEVTGARKVLNAAALTYVAAFITSLLTLLYWAYALGLFGGRRD